MLLMMLRRRRSFSLKRCPPLSSWWCSVLCPSLGGGVQLFRCLSSFVSLHWSPSVARFFFFKPLVSHLSPTCLLPRLPLNVSDTCQMTWQKIETAWHENILLMISIGMDQKLPASGTSITTKMHRDPAMDME